MPHSVHSPTVSASSTESDPLPKRIICRLDLQGLPQLGLELRDFIFNSGLSLDLLDLGSLQRLALGALLFQLVDGVEL